MKNLFAWSLVGSIGAMSPVAVTFSASPFLELLTSQGVGEVDTKNSDHTEKHGRHETIEREGEGRPREDATFVGTRPPAGVGSRIAWYGVAAMLSIVLGWVGLLIGGRRVIS